MISPRNLKLPTMVLLLLTGEVVSVGAIEPEGPINIGSRLELLLGD